MKHLVNVIIIAFFIFATIDCSSKVIHNDLIEQSHDTIYINDTIFDTTYIDNTYNFEYKLDSLDSLYNGIKSELFIANYKLERIKYYIKIVDNRPANSKYLKGWIKRVLNG